MAAPHTEAIPLISIIIPVHNGASDLEEAVRSAAAQTHSRVEVRNSKCLLAAVFEVSSYRFASTMIGARMAQATL